ncbi:hypothetical protein CQ052_02310 [Ochrobactrum sp. MYb15]|uniref:Uncharacterized protein n=1 Tax=Brucella pituitosa TaxID=571256 RepID=A0A643F678_9HYPH|nr:hypothetical protein F7Q93_04070 [Brucella pituitosa]PQZ49460.1 hypothetical protein CQZ90_13185 [Ochrobactrum sp. MYb19]PRA57318.1 hypothetical protein CQ062_00710 [Ochrobactrum sp. MYb68]PRA66722.1 hypothetical protein CQ053_05135 [Ochrobactrum sp. MYb18]PRA76249.1 hypothetical protein CQ049_02310 [Brucella thiophenivorans]PRA89265.1 hypothetical protein CQ054_03860 [Ochrobactrum sp. MYb29]PRA91732.1 hypothetical protein CQ051_06150 [Ochrobactrum sp. MYb14]PRA98255.1 hypothetical protei
MLLTCSALVSGMHDCNQVIRCLPSFEFTHPDNHPVDIPCGTGKRHLAIEMPKLSSGALPCFLSKAKRILLFRARL